MLENFTQCKDQHEVETFSNDEKILILGHGRHGKDTAAKITFELFGLTFESSSRAAFDAIYPALQFILDDSDNDRETLYTARRRNRGLWKTLISLYNSPDKTSLCKLILSKNDMYVGMRCNEEYRASRWMFSKVIWIDASRRKPFDESMGIEYDPENMIWIDNNGSEAELVDNIIKAFKVEG